MDEQHLEAAVEQWRSEGWVLIDGLLPAAEVEAARAEIESRGRELDPPTRRSTRPVDEVLSRSGDGDPAFRDAQFSGTTLFPVPDAPRLNRLFVRPEPTRFARRALGTDDIRIYQSRVWSKYGDRVDYAQPLHRDLNHSLIPTRSEPGWWFLECFVYLHDVDDDNGAPKLVPRSAVEGPDTARPVGPDDAPELYAAEVSAPGSTGSLLAYRSDVWHRGVHLPPGAERHIMVVAYKPAGLDWVGFDAHPPLVINRDFVHFAAQCTPDELSLFGMPRPGHPVWTPELVDGLARRYPGLDVELWRRALVNA